MENAPELALGTVQFGLAYGIAGAAQRVPDAEISAILHDAHDAGVRMLDTAPAYGDIEARIVPLLPPGREFQITSKIAPLPAEALTADADRRVAVRHLMAGIDQSVARLGDRLTTLLFHRPEDLDTAQGPALWHEARAHGERLGIRVGISVYDPAARPACCEEVAADVIQCPANAFDQRLLAAAAGGGLREEVHIRSALLQGLLTMDPARAAGRLPAAAAALSRWHTWCAQRSLSALQGAFAFIKSAPARYCLVGVDSRQQFAQVAAAWRAAAPEQMPELAVRDLSIIDPRNWQTVKPR